MVYRYGSYTKHYTPLKQRVKVDSNCIPGEIETRGKNKKQEGGKRDMHTKKKILGLPQKKYDILLLNCIGYLRK